jgi:hypothetical protein
MDARKVEAKEIVPASRKLGEREAKQLAKEASKIFVAKGKSVESFAGGSATAEIVKKMLGPTGNLRAPTIRVGKTLLVGFHEDTYDEVFGR